jgi:hypothetical protein
MSSKPSNLNVSTGYSVVRFAFFPHGYNQSNHYTCASVSKIMRYHAASHYSRKNYAFLCVEHRKVDTSLVKEVECKLTKSAYIDKIVMKIGCFFFVLVWYSGLKSGFLLSLPNELYNMKY